MRKQPRRPWHLWPNKPQKPHISPTVSQKQADTLSRSKVMRSAVDPKSGGVTRLVQRKSDPQSGGCANDHLRGQTAVPARIQDQPQTNPPRGDDENGFHELFMND